MATSEPEIDALADALAAYFEADEVKFKPAVVSGNRALALGYVTARAVQDRLDQVLGVGGWQDDYEVLEGGSVLCRLRVRLGGEWVTKCDVGSPSEQPDDGDKMKAAFSDALKRAAVKLGVGRYLYRLPQQWCDYDPHKRQFTRPPALPAWALPGHAAGGRAAPGTGRGSGPAPSAKVKAPPSDPATVTELLPWLERLDRQLLQQGMTLQPREVQNAVARELKVVAAGLESLPEAKVPAAVGEAKAFARQRREAAGLVRGKEPAGEPDRAPAGAK
jgi:hypothetical protein